MDNIFTSLDPGAEQAGAPVVEKKEASKNTRRERIEAMKAAIQETALTDPEFKQKLKSLSDSLEVVNTLGFGDSGNIVLDKSSTADKRKVVSTSQIVGYRVRNIGDVPIKYQTEVWTQGEDGKFVPTKTEKVIAPGATAELTRQFMTMLCAQPEISFTLANGKIIRGAGTISSKSLKDELEAHYFRFDKDENGVKKQVNDDSVKLNVGRKVDGKWVVKDEYVETFGFLNNPKPGGRRGGRKSARDKYSAQDLAANYIRKMIEEHGEM